MNHINRYGETSVKPAKGAATVEIESEDEYGMHRTEASSAFNWSLDPRSVSAHEKHLTQGGVRDSLSDKDLTAKIEQDLSARLGKGRNIIVTVQSGVVTLSGLVRSREEKKSADGVLLKFDDIRDCFNQLQIDPNLGN